MAMQAEAAPLIEELQLLEDTNAPFPGSFPWRKFSGDYLGLSIHIVCTGKDPVFGVDSVCTVPSSLLLYASIQLLKPDLIINCGTAGGFQTKGAAIGDVYLVTETSFHDRRIPIPGFTEYGIGTLKATSTDQLVAALGLKEGILTTGDSLDHVTEDITRMNNNGASVKDMEGAAVAYVANMLSTPLILFKGVTDIVDSPAPTAEEFLANLSLAAKAIQSTVASALKFLSGKTLRDLQ